MRRVRRKGEEDKRRVGGGGEGREDVGRKWEEVEGSGRKVEEVGRKWKEVGRK